ncbi:uncharacterized protein LOC116255430 [Nymphaea colorata]|nr:uncharacterized protein LOC116255430 [Nymphaea colorata]
MAMQTGIGLTKVLILVGAGYSGAIVLKNGRLLDIVGDLQTLLKGIDKSGESSNAESDYSEALASQVRRLAMEVRHLASARQITVVNGDSGQMGNVASLLVPAAALGALGYGYMKWKGLSFSDLMYVTKRNMANAVTSMTKHLEQVSAALAATKRHLTQRIENLDGKLDEQKDLTKLLKNEVTEVRQDISQIGIDLEVLQKMVCGLDGKIGALEDKQDFANAGVWYLCQFVGGTKDGKMPEFLQGQTKPPKRLLGFSDIPSAKGLQYIADTIKSGTTEKSKTNAIFQTGTEGLENTKSLTRIASVGC